MKKLSKFFALLAVVIISAMSLQSIKVKAISNFKIEYLNSEATVNGVKTDTVSQLSLANFGISFGADAGEIKVGDTIEVTLPSELTDPEFTEPACRVYDPANELYTQEITGNKLTLKFTDKIIDPVSGISKAISFNANCAYQPSKSAIIQQGQTILADTTAVIKQSGSQTGSASDTVLYTSANLGGPTRSPIHKAFEVGVYGNAAAGTKTDENETCRIKNPGSVAGEYDVAAEPCDDKFSVEVRSLTWLSNGALQNSIIPNYNTNDSDLPRFNPISNVKIIDTPKNGLEIVSEPFNTYGENAIRSQYHKTNFANKSTSIGFCPDSHIQTVATAEGDTVVTNSVSCADGKLQVMLDPNAPAGSKAKQYADQYIKSAELVNGQLIVEFNEGQKVEQNQFKITYWTKITASAEDDKTFTNEVEIEAKEFSSPSFMSQYTRKDLAFHRVVSVLSDDAGGELTKNIVTKGGAPATENTISSLDEKEFTYTLKAQTNTVVPVDQYFIRDTVPFNFDASKIVYDNTKWKLSVDGNKIEFSNIVEIKYLEENTFEIPVNDTKFGTTTPIAAGEEIKNVATLENKYFLADNLIKSNEVVTKSVRGGLTIKKVDATRKSPLAGAKFDLKDKTGKVVGTLTSGADGIMKIDGLYFGDYDLTEIQAPIGYEKLNLPTKVTIDKDSLTKEVEVTNKASKTVEILKVDSETNAPLAGAKFEIKDATGTVVKTVVTDATGKIDVTGLDSKVYTIVEVEAPVGYELDSTPTTVDLTTELTQKVTIKNVKTPDPTPTPEPTPTPIPEPTPKPDFEETGTHDLVILFAGLLLAGIGFTTRKLIK